MRSVALMLAVGLATAFVPEPVSAQSDDVQCARMEVHVGDIFRQFAWPAAPFQLKQDQLEEAVAACKRAAATPASGAAAAPTSQNARTAALARASVGVATASTSALDEAARLDPSLPHVPAYRAMIALYMLDLVAAAEHLTAAIALDPRNASFVTWRGLTHYGRGLFADQALNAAAAYADAEKALSIEPDQPDALLLRGHLLLRMGAADRALADFDRVLARGSHVVALTGRADALVLLGRRAEALRDYAAAVQQQPFDTERAKIEQKMNALLNAGVTPRP